MTRHRVLIVDDSRTMQRLIASVIEKDPELEVVGFASDPLEAREAVKRLNPDVITLDVEMPHMNGLEFLEKIMRLRPMPVIMVSSLTASSTDLAVQALAIGAVDCVGKPTSYDGEIFAGLAEKVRHAAVIKYRPVTPTREPAKRATSANDYRWNGRIVAIGSSAGGIEALSDVLNGFPSNGPPIVITQHMPAGFTRSLATRLGRLCDASVSEAEDGATLKSGSIYVAPGGPAHLEIVGKDHYHCRLREGPLVAGHRPAVDVLFESVAKVVGSLSVGVILSGMGRDGTDGLLAMRRAGAQTIGQDEATSFIYGMPRSAFEKGAVERQLPVKAIGPAILAATALKKEPILCR